MNIGRKFAVLLSLLLIMTLAAYARGYNVVVKTEQRDTSHFIITRWEWGNRVVLDTIKAHKGKAVYKGKGEIGTGQYEIAELSGKKLIEFIVPRENQNFAVSYRKGSEGMVLEKGNVENKIYTEFQNFLDYGWEKLDSREQFAERIAQMSEEAHTKCPGSITDIILENAMFIPASAEDLKNNFPFNDTIILNTRFAEDKTEQYLKLLMYNHNDTIIKYVDNLIGEAGNSLLKQKIAHTVYNFFKDSEIMGQEGVAVAVAQKWFLQGDIECYTPQEKFMMRSFVELNKNSLIGMDAPELLLVDTLGEKISLRGMEGEYTILYFYTDDCQTCKRETPRLVDLVNNYDEGTLAVYAVYANDNQERWKKYINDELVIFHPFMNWANVYDPDYSSGFQMLYNVVGTPRIYLLDKEKKIIGRGLDVNTLKELLEEKNRQRDELRGFIEEFFTPVAGDTAKIKEGIDKFYQSCRENKDLFNEFFSEIYLFLGRSENYLLQEGAVYLAEKYIIGMPQMWSDEYVEKARKSVKIFNMNKLGDTAADIHLERIDGSPVDIFDVTTEYKVLYFYRPNCGICTATTPELAEIYKEFKDKLDISFLAINLGKGYQEWIEYVGEIGAGWDDVRGEDGNNDEIYEKYHLESIPSIYLLQGNVVVAKEITYKQLEETLKFIIQ